MKISELPTPRLRARAMELALAENKERSARWHYNLDEAFVWSDTEEYREFWLACYEGNWDKAKELQPDLFKPVAGKPHLVVGEYNDFGEKMFYSLIVKNCEIFKESDLEACYRYIQEVHPDYCYTIQEAVDALYSFKREENQ